MKDEIKKSLKSEGYIDLKCDDDWRQDRFMSSRTCPSCPDIFTDQEKEGKFLCRHNIGLSIGNILDPYKNLFMSPYLYTDKVIKKISLKNDWIFYDEKYSTNNKKILLGDILIDINKPLYIYER